MSTRIFEGSNNTQVQDLRVYNVEGSLNQLPPELAKTIFELLDAIPDATHLRDRKRSPPDSACLPGTRKAVIKWIITWVSSGVLLRKHHVLWVYGYVGCGKSAIAQEVSVQVQGKGRLLATFFFFRGAGDRSKIARLPNTLASQMAASLPKTAPLIETAVKAEPELLKTKSALSLGARLQRLVYEPFKAVMTRASQFAKSFLSDPYLIVIDGLDECKEKEGVEEFIITTLKFFKDNPFVPLRVMITSRVEQHIHSHLTTDAGVILKDLADHCSREDIEKFMEAVFSAEIQASRVLQAHTRQYGSWPKRADAQKLVDHIGGSFIFASILFKFIFNKPASKDDHSTPLDRFPLALNIDPGLDGLYSETLARSEHLPHFTDIISTLALLANPLPVSGIAELLEIPASAVAYVLVDLQAIIQVPGTDDAPVTFYHTSLRDFLTTESRSERFFTPPSFHPQILIRCLSCELRVRRCNPQVGLEAEEQTAAVQYSLSRREGIHWNRGSSSFASVDLEKLVELRREMVQLAPEDERGEGLCDLAFELESLFKCDQSTSTIEEAISMHREALSLRPHPHPDRHDPLNNLGSALYLLFGHSQNVYDIRGHFDASRGTQPSSTSPPQPPPFSEQPWQCTRFTLRT